MRLNVGEVGVVLVSFADDALLHLLYYKDLLRCLHVQLKYYVVWYYTQALLMYLIYFLLI